MIKRPLFIFCGLIVVFISLLYTLKNGTSPAEYIPQDEELLIEAKVGSRDDNSLILKDIYIKASEEKEIKPECKLKIKYKNISEGGIPPIGSRVLIRGIYYPYSASFNPGEFDTRKYYESLNIGGSLTNVEILSISDKYSVIGESLFSVRQKLEERLYSIFPEKEASIMSAILLGDKGNLDEDTKELYQKNGIIHILSISGLHITLIGMGIYKLLKKTGLSRRASAVSGCLALLVYGLLVGFPVSVIRAVGMYIIRMGGDIILRTYDMLTATGIMAVIVLLINPGYIGNTGFLLSFLSVMGVGYVLYTFEFEDDEEKGDLKYEENEKAAIIKEKFKGTAEGLLKAVRASLCISVTTLPVMLASYYEVPVYSMFLNALILPLMGVLVVTGFGAMFVPGMGSLGTADVIILFYYEKLCKLFESLPHSMWNPGCPKPWRIALYYIILTAFVELYKYGIKKNKRIKFKHKQLLSLIIILLPVVFLIPAHKAAGLSFLYVGQGNGVVLETESGRTYIFDFGSTSRDEVGRYVLKPYLKYKGIGYVDAVFISHTDADHMNGIEELLANREAWGIGVGAVVAAEAQRELFSEFSDKYEARVVYIKQGSSFADRGIRITCLHPAPDFPVDDINAASECFLIESDNGVKILLTGDVQALGEEALISEIKRRGISDITLLQCPHHGSKNSTTKELLSLIEPKATVISCGLKNRYSHPHAELLERLKESETEVFRTDIQGAILTEFDGEGIKLRSYLK
ncbi:MAG: DNA internalization-related competence protein ComEC/Rec2 [Lachnospiraceae bacterium]|nr:DNA internalization-related competence protein ComEC/Rec2 [Lachnospiraceae bacterium]